MPNSIPTNAECFLSPKWVRGYCSGQLIVDSRSSILLRSDGRPPAYYFPKQDINMNYLHRNFSTPGNHIPQIRHWDLRVGDKWIRRAATEYHKADDAPAIEGYLCFNWASMDNWFEEQEEIFIHPRDPWVRLDVLRSSRHIEVIIHDEIVAASNSPVALFETGLPVRYYLPKPDVRLELLIESQHVTQCPYKGEANYYSVRISKYTEENVAWYYQYPTLEASKIASHIAFYSEKVDAFLVDGVLQ